MDLSLKPTDLRLNTYKEMVGRTILDRYELEALIGFGGMGAVFRGTQRAINRTVAIKILPKLDPLTAARFHREAKTASRLAHPNTITIFDFGQTPDEFLFLVMEYLEGRTLRAVLKECGAMHPARALHIAMQICKSLSEAHSIGIVHRDIKPDNIFLLNRDDDPDYLKVLDFGIAKVLAGDEIDADLTQQGRIVGTPRYMAPEQVMSLPIDHRADIYSLGVILYQMLVGAPPFDDASTPMLMMKHAHEQPQEFAGRLGHNPETLAHIPAGLEAIVMRALSKNPEDRQQSVDQLRIELSQIRMSLSGMYPLPAMPSYASGVMPSLSPHTPNPTLQSSPSLSQPSYASQHGVPPMPSPAQSSSPSLSQPSMSGFGTSNPSLSQPSMAGLSHPSHPSHPSLVGYPPQQPSQERRFTYVLLGVAILGLLIGGVGLGAFLANNGGQERAQDSNTDLSAAARPPETATIPETSVRITIESEPQGAIIRSGDFEVGTTPMVIEVPAELKAVTYQLQREGFEAVSKEFDIPRLPGREVTWRVDLRPLNAAREEKAAPAAADRNEGTLTPTPQNGRPPATRTVRQPSPPTKTAASAPPASAAPVAEPATSAPRKPNVATIGGGGDTASPGTAASRKPSVNIIGDEGSGEKAPAKPKVSVPTLE